MSQTDFYKRKEKPEPVGPGAIVQPSDFHITYRKRDAAQP